MFFEHQICNASWKLYRNTGNTSEMQEERPTVWPACSLIPCKVISQKVLQLRHSLVSAKKKSWQDERLFNQDYQKNLSFIFYISAQSMTIYNEYNVTSIGCFHCTSIGGDNPACEDPFNSTEAFEKGLYKDNCLAGLKGRGGLYPATACIKFDGYYSKYFFPFLWMLHE